MENVEYMAVSFSLVWLLMVAYLWYLHSLTSELSRQVDQYQSTVNNEDSDA